jgi:hypothetical protein
MKITLEQFQTDFVTGLDSVVVGAQWLQDLMRERDKLQREMFALQKTNGGLIEENARLKNKILCFELSDNKIYILDTLA